MTIRPAREDEVEAVLPMYEWLFAPPGPPVASWNPGRGATSLAAAIAGTDSTVLVAEADDGTLVGLITAYLDLDSVRFGRRCWVEDLAVSPVHRSAGVGKALLDSAKAWARERGATHLELDTGWARADAQRFYEREQPDGKSVSYSWTL